ncbi:acyl--CoA ligase [Streptacidiphilus sp. PB12-B1b]|uniref:AMP-binding enzyme n=1 Tax=Streptacidiphilus sp. PB12-B1b TaxID=2705012 RepID=UPI0015FD1B18|nr:class I adenylate-forming enzyme family protein [Streptacidiphilus sp. PB12-B1b]QMU78286.1 acyl--CoA ligase [Streptacidiphilus sp. PB12-B1b]
MVAATPSFWRMTGILAARGGRRPRPVGTVSTGGEPVDDPLLDLIRTVVAPDRIVQIFGTTEIGSLLSVTDGRSGLPAALMGRRLPGGGAFEVQDGRLLVSPAEGQPFHRTGDLVRLCAGRVQLIGRDQSVINVGGQKVPPHLVRTALERHPRVLAARVYAVRSPVLGQVVGADVVASDDTDPAALAADVKAYARERLAPYEVPRRVRVVHELRLAPSGKINAHE